MDSLPMTLCRAFGLPAATACRELTAGHIHASYRVACADGAAYLVQRINRTVFADLDGMMQNIALVTAHLRRKAEARGEDDRHFLRYRTTESGALWYQAEDGAAYRVCNFVDGAVTPDSIGGADALRKAGMAFGAFARDLNDFDATRLTETLPQFHNTPRRLRHLLDTAAADPVGRKAECLADLAFIEEQTAFAARLVKGLSDGSLPLRVTHNDTKTNNVLLDERTLEPLTVVDLDTVMPGAAAVDFADAIRFSACTAAEDEPDLTKVALDLSLCRAYTEGYLGTATFLTDAERASLAEGAAVITLEQAVRFLDDYLAGDTYYRIDYATQNLVRARCQLALYRDLRAHLAELDALVRAC